MGRSTPKNFALPAEAAELPEPEIKLGALNGATLDFTTMFSPDSRIEVEVGVGKGRFLSAVATAKPEIGFVGVERAAPYVRLVRHKILLAGLRNVRLIRADAADVFRRLVPAAVIDEIHVLFPDPWPKRKHHGRRLLTPAFIADLARAVRPGGYVNIVTDHPDYALVIPLAAEHPLLERQPTPRIAGDLSAMTHFATRLATRGAIFQAFTWRRR